MRARLERLEELMGSMLMRTELPGVLRSPTVQAQSQVASAEGVGPVSQDAQLADPGRPLRNVKNTATQLGQLIFRDGYCIYFSVDFWAAMMDEVFVHL